MLNAPVTAIARRDRSVIVRAKDRSFEGPAAIVTVPLGVLKSGAITFDPPLPDGHARAVNALGFGVLSKSYFRFSRRTWDTENAFYQFLGTDPGAWSQWFTLPSTAGPIALAFNAGDRGRSVESSAPNAAPTHSTHPGPASTTDGSCRTRSATDSIWRVRPSGSTIRPPLRAPCSAAVTPPAN